MMRRVWFLFFLLFTIKVRASDTTRLYNPRANAEQDLQLALLRAGREGKHVLLQIGGNWCVPCYRFHALVRTDSTLRRMMDTNFVVYHLNYSRENRNLSLMNRFGNPQRFGFPVLVVLDAAGNRLHTQNSGLLLRGNGFDEQKVREFLALWTPEAHAGRKERN